MADPLSKARRSWVMSRVKGKDTKPEILARSLLHRLGYRFTVNGPKNKSLPGRPDIVLPKRRAAIFVHGCFWHLHEGCKQARPPKSNQAYWQPKLARNVERDRANQAALLALGWQPIVIWECELKDPLAVAAKLVAALPRTDSYPLPADLEDALLAAETQAAYGKRSGR